jgi:molecular chaperone HscB
VTPIDGLRVSGNSDPFAVLGLPRAFALDAVELDRRWRERAREVHPDRLARAGPPSAEARRRAEEAATRLNDARRLLADWTERARLLLAPPPAQGERAALPELPRVTDPAFLGAQLEAREALAAAAGDARDRLADAARASLAALEREVAELLRAALAPDVAVRAAVLARLARARFHQALLAEAGRREPLR